MKKLTIFLYAIFIASTVILMYIIYKDIDNPYILKFIIGYLIFLMTFVLYLIAAAIMKMRSLKWVDKRKRLISFIIWFVSFLALNLISSYLFKLPSKGVLGELAVPLGLATGIAFLDIVFASSKGE